MPFAVGVNVERVWSVVSVCHVTGRGVMLIIHIGRSWLTIFVLLFEEG